MNGLSQVLDQFVTNSYPIFSLSNSTTNLTPIETIVSSERQLAFETYDNKALVDRDRAQTQSIVYTTSAVDFDNGVFNGLTDTDNCLNNYFSDQQLTHEWQQFNDSLISGDNNLNTGPLIDANDLNQCLNSFGNNFETNIDLNSNSNENNNIKQNSKKLNNKSTNAKKLSRKESAPSVRPPKPVSAYALFFRDAQSQIKSANPSASFGEISKVVASNWEALDKKDKNIYKQRADQEKKNYLKTLASSRAQQIAGLMANSAKLGLNSMSATNDNKLTNDTDLQNNEKSNQFNPNQQQMADNSSTVRNNASGDQNIANNSSQQNVVQKSGVSDSGVPKPHCIRNGCTNDAIDSTEWDSEYCSSECCVKHCSDVFQAWVQKQQYTAHN